MTACSRFVKTKAHTTYLKIYKNFINRIVFYLFVLFVCLEFKITPQSRIFTQPLQVKGYTF